MWRSPLQNNRLDLVKAFDTKYGNEPGDDDDDRGEDGHRNGGDQAGRRVSALHSKIF